MDDTARASVVEASGASTADTTPPLDTAGLFHTSEIRWFAHGPIPPDIEHWFTAGGTMGSREGRVDTYQLYGINDIGVKRRNRRTLEVKVRRTLGAHLNLGYGLEGRIEEWTRWTPDEDEGTWQSADKGWVGVHKVVHTRTFAPTGKQLALPTREPARSDIGCDIEVVAINALKSDTWSLSLEAYGPTVERRAALETSWSALQMHSPLPEAFAFMFDRACGYPEWLRLVT